MPEPVVTPGVPETSSRGDYLAPPGPTTTSAAAAARTSASGLYAQATTPGTAALSPEAARLATERLEAARRLAQERVQAVRQQLQQYELTVRAEVARAEQELENWATQRRLALERGEHLRAAVPAPPAATTRPAPPPLPGRPVVGAA